MHGLALRGRFQECFVSSLCQIEQNTTPLCVFDNWGGVGEAVIEL